ncbi:MAG: hypothetical protein GF313_16425 [Caldithrix sp.]|nr:hypothetical protein [Caldithrix sp.]
MRDIMNRFTILLILLFVQGLLAQPITVESVKPLWSDNQKAFYHPRFGVGDSTVFVTGSGFEGLHVININNGQLTTITEARGAGYAFAQSPDGQYVTYRTQEFVKRRPVYELKRVDLKNGKISILEADKRSLKMISTGIVARLTYLDNATVRQSAISGENQILSQDDIPFVTIQRREILLWDNGEQKMLAPLGKQKYIWPSISPDGQKLLFTAAGVGTFISDLHGNIENELGYANAPQWSADGNWIVFMMDRDDGHRITASDIYAISADGSRKIQLTASQNTIEMYPDWGHQSNKIVYNTQDGRIFLMELTTE